MSEYIVISLLPCGCLCRITGVKRLVEKESLVDNVVKVYSHQLSFSPFFLSFLSFNILRLTDCFHFFVESVQSLLYTSDYVNHRYLHKRAAFLAHLAGYLDNWDGVDSVCFGRAGSNPLLPILIVKPHGQCLKLMKKNHILN